MSLVILDSICKTWQGRGLVSPQTLSFTADKAYQIVGNNGCGKTTLLKIICGLLSPDQGTYGSTSSFSWCSDRGVGATPRLTGQENIDHMKFFLKGSEPPQDWHHLSGFTDALKTEYGLCSQGMQMLISLYISTLSRAQVLVWDEPFSHLSPENTQVLLENWRQLTGASCLIFSTHEHFDHNLCETIAL